MTEYKRDLKADLAIFNIGGRSTEDIVYGVVAPHALERAIAAEEEVERLNHLLTKKDATIEKLQDMSQRWEKAFTNADKQYLKKEKEAAELRRMIDRRDERLTEKDATIKELKQDKRKIYATYDEQCARSSEYYNEIIRLRKALEEAVRKYETGDLESDFGDILDGIYETCKGALGEGNKQKITVTLHNRGYAKHELNFGEGDKQ